MNRYFYPDVSATSQILHDLARRLAAMNMDVHVICSRQLYEDASAALPGEETVDGVRVHRVRTTQFGRGRLTGRALDYLSFYVAAILKSLGIVRRGDILVAKTDPPLICIPMGLVARWRGATLVNWLQDLFPEAAVRLGARIPAGPGRYLMRLRDRSLHQALANVVIGSRMQAYLRSRGVDPDRMVVIENWADGALIECLPTAASRIRSQLGKQVTFVVSYSGNLGRAHDHETILAAAIALRDELDIAFLMVGGGTRMQLLRKAAAGKGLRNMVFLPYQPRAALSDSMAAADVHLATLLPHLEGLIVPSKFYGILASGRPTLVIGDPDGEIARIVNRERIGAAVAAGDWRALVEHIRRMKRDPAALLAVGQRARAVFLQKYTAEQAARAWANLLDAVVKEKSSGAAAVARRVT